MTPGSVRVAGGQGFWGDWLEAPYRQVTGGPIDYLMMDYLAEVTMSIRQKQKSRDSSRGYAIDFITQEVEIDPRPAFDYFGFTFRRLEEGLREYLP